MIWNLPMIWNGFKKLFYIGIVIAGLILLWNWLWFSPELWNGTAAKYKTRGDSLQMQATMLTRLNATKDSVITDIAKRWQDAISYGEKFKADLANQMAASDRDAAKLTQPEQEQAIYVGLQGNGTLDKNLNPATLKPTDGPVVLANLQTIGRQAKGAKALDSIGRVIGSLTVKTDRMGGVLTRTGSSLAVLSPSLRKSAKKAKILGLINTKSSKAFTAAANKVDSVRRDIQKESELEEELNKKY